MNIGKGRTRTVLLLLGIISVLAAIMVTVAGANQPELPAYLQTATYKTSGKCKMCHKGPYTAWSTTKHACPTDKYPWEADGKPAPGTEEIYRHSTGFNAKDNSVVEKGTACEACHGPGSEHMAAKKEERAAKITNPAKLGTAAQQLSLCGRCHGQYTIGDKRYAADYQFGQDLLATDGFKLDPVKTEAGVKMQQLNEFVTSEHMKEGLSCVSCHTAHADQPQAHNLAKPVIELCSGCHKDKTMAAHAPDAPKDATCATCHMPDGRHTFAVPKK